MRVYYLSAEAPPCEMDFQDLMNNFAFAGVFDQRSCRFTEPDIMDELAQIGFFTDIHDNGSFSIISSESISNAEKQ